MKYLLIAMLLFAAGCADNEKKAAENNPVAQADIKGQLLFKNNCASCHKCDKDFVGPALQGALERWGDKKAMYDFIRNPGKSVEENAYAKKVFEKWSGAIMTSFPALSDAEIDAILDYCESPIP